MVHSHIGYGAPHKHDSFEAHGEPLGDDEVRLTKQFFGFDPDQQFVVPDGVREHFAAQLGARGAGLRTAWEAMFKRYRAEYPDLADQIERLSERRLPAGWETALPVFPPQHLGSFDARCIRQGAERDGGANPLDRRRRGGSVAQHQDPSRLRVGRRLPARRVNLGDHRGRNMHFGVREHAMCAAVNGMTLTGLRAFGSGFLIFTDYARGSIRLSSLMDLPVLHIWTHDSISVGEDGPTHQPIEQIVSLRAIPGMVVIRPADANEMTEAYRYVLQQRHRPTALICSRQALPIVDRTQFAPAARSREGRLCAGRCAGWQAGRDPDRQRQRGVALPGRA